MRLVVPFDRGDFRSQIHEQAEVLEETFTDDGYRLQVKSSQPVLARFAEFVADPGGRAGAAGTAEA